MARRASNQHNGFGNAVTVVCRGTPAREFFTCRLRRKRHSGVCGTDGQKTETPDGAANARASKEAYSLRRGIPAPRSPSVDLEFSGPFPSSASGLRTSSLGRCETIKFKCARWQQFEGRLHPLGQPSGAQRPRRRAWRQSTFGNGQLKGLIHYSNVNLRIEYVFNVCLWQT